MTRSERKKRTNPKKKKKNEKNEKMEERKKKIKKGRDQCVDHGLSMAMTLTQLYAFNQMNSLKGIAQNTEAK